MTKKKGSKGHRAKSPTQPWATDALIGDEEQNGKQKKDVWKCVKIKRVCVSE